MIRRLAKIIAVVTTFAALAGLTAVSIYVWRVYQATDLDPARFSRGSTKIMGTVFTDRHGWELRFVPDDSGERGRWVAVQELPPVVKGAFLAAEDGRFYRHHGFDARAIGRALWGNLTRRLIVSGASTITQQLVRLVYPADGRRSYRAKLTEICRSVKLEQAISKEAILEQYLNRVPMGNNLAGVETAAHAYFGRPARNLTAAQAALLASLPKAPSQLNPYGGNRERLLARQGWVLGRMRQLGFLTENEYRVAQAESLALREFCFDLQAPHLVDQLLARGIKGGVVRTTIDLPLQLRVQQILASHAERLRGKGAHQGAALIIDNRTMEVLATVGSLAYEERDGGFNNGVLAPRSAGSTLKPFLYALALESGYPVTTLLEDTERIYRAESGQYQPSNFDRRQYGPVTIRTALGNSLNLSAVKTLKLLGEREFYDLLVRLNLITDPSKGPDHYGLGLAIGNLEISLEQLASAYAALANGGEYQPVRYLLGKRNSGAPRSIFLPQTAYIIGDILADPTARMLTFGRSRAMDFPFRVCVKTGTSTYYRDLWALGYTPEYTVAVWVGNFNGAPTARLSGASAAAPILQEILGQLYRQGGPPRFKRPAGVKRVKVCGYSGMKPTPHCRQVVAELFYAGSEPDRPCTFHARDDQRHELATPYAGWLFDRNQSGAAGRFRIDGFGDDLAKVFHDPWQKLTAEATTPLVRQKNPPATVAASPLTAGAASSGGHFQVGRDAGAAGPSQAQGNGANSVRIVYPLDQDRFVVNRAASNQLIKLRAVSDRPVPYIDWYVNGVLYERTGPPYQTYWPLVPGRYRITAADPASSGDAVSVRVE